MNNEPGGVHYYVKHRSRSVPIRSAPGQVQLKAQKPGLYITFGLEGDLEGDSKGDFSLQIKFNSLELYSEVGRFVHLTNNMISDPLLVY